MIGSYAQPPNRSSDMPSATSAENSCIRQDNRSEDKDLLEDKRGNDSVVPQLEPKMLKQLRALEEEKQLEIAQLKERQCRPYT